MSPTGEAVAVAVAGMQWSKDFEVLDGHMPAADAMQQVLASPKGWFVVRRHGGLHHYVFAREELLRVLRANAPGVDALGEVLDLHEEDSSRVMRPGDFAVSAQPRHAALPSVFRYVELDGGGAPQAVAGRGITAAPPLRRGRRRGGTLGAWPPAPLPSGAPAPAAVALDDEGTTPVRYPSLELAGAIAPGAPVTLVIDLLRQATAHTAGGALAIGEQAANWETLDLGVTAVSAAIDFAQGGRGKLTIRRNKGSVKAQLQGTSLATLAAGDRAEVHAQFWDGTRCCGMAQRSFEVVASPGAVPQAAQPPTVGRMAADPAAKKPDLTVYITMLDRSAPGKLHWRLVTEPFDDLPARLDGMIDLGREPGREAAELFKEFANLPRGDHQRRIEAFGERLWKRAPEAFRDTYWALVDHYKRPLTIQFTSDDPYLPWELMRPSRRGEMHPPLALGHAVARWIGAYQGWLRNQLPAGDLVVVAPRYSTASLRLSLAEETAQAIVDGYGARALPGTRAAMLELLEQPPEGTVSLLYFTGHGLFNDAAAAASAIKLENRESLAADEVGREAVLLGERHGTVVFFNACEVGATAGSIGDVGGWADALLGRRFRAFIAPLWAIDEDDAAQATKTLIEKIVRQHQPMGEALRELREEFGAVSPTFYSYLLFGDVTAHFGN